MEIEVTQSGELAVLVLTGDLDMVAADHLKRTLSELVDSGQLRLVIDLGGVGYVDSSGLHALVLGMKQARMAGGDVKLCALQADVRSVFEMTRLNKHVAVYPTREEAMTSWGGT